MFNIPYQNLKPRLCPRLILPYVATVTFLLRCQKTLPHKKAGRTAGKHSDSLRILIAHALSLLNIVQPVALAPNISLWNNERNEIFEPWVISYVPDQIFSPVYVHILTEGFLISNKVLRKLGKLVTLWITTSKFIFLMESPMKSPLFEIQGSKSHHKPTNIPTHYDVFFA